MLYRIVVLSVTCRLLPPTDASPCVWAVGRVDYINTVNYPFQYYPPVYPSVLHPLGFPTRTKTCLRLLSP